MIYICNCNWVVARWQ